MKKTLLTLNAAALAITIATAIGCKKEDNSNPIIGAWEVRNLTTRLTDLSTNPPVILRGAVSFKPGGGLYLEIWGNNTFLSSDSATGKNVASGTYTVGSGNKYIFQVTGSVTRDTMGLTINGSTLIATTDKTTNNKREQDTLTLYRR